MKATWHVRPRGLVTAAPRLYSLAQHSVRETHHPDQSLHEFSQFLQNTREHLQTDHFLFFSESPVSTFFNRRSQESESHYGWRSVSSPFLESRPAWHSLPYIVVAVKLMSYRVWGPYLPTDWAWQLPVVSLAVYGTSFQIYTYTHTTSVEKYTAYTQPLLVLALYSRSCLMPLSFCCKGSLLISAAFSLTASKFEPNIFCVAIHFVQCCKHFYSHVFLWLLLSSRIILWTNYKRTTFWEPDTNPRVDARWKVANRTENLV